MKASKDHPERIVRSLVVPFSEIPFDGVALETSDSFQALHRDDEESEDPSLFEVFNQPIKLKGSITPVGSKVDIRGDFETDACEICDRCTTTFKTQIRGSISTFLMPERQFSKHDKPGGKVIHGPMRDQKKSRHHSRSKAPVLTDAEGEHEDVSFGAFDGETVDLRGLLREQLILSLPMTRLCTPDCKGLCLTCGENINRAECHCPGGPKTLDADEVPFEKPLSPLQQALKEKFSAT